MNVNWSKIISESGWYLCVVDGLCIRDAEVHWIDVNKDQGDVRGNIWHLGPIQGYPTTNLGILDA